MTSFRLRAGLAATLLVVLALPARAAPEPRYYARETVLPVAVKADGEATGRINRLMLSPAELTAPHEIHFELRLRNFEELSARIERGEVLSLDELRDRHLPTREEWQKVANWARSQGFSVGNETISRMTVRAHGNIALTQRAFQMHFVLIPTLTIRWVSDWIMAETAAGRPVNQVSASFGIPEPVMTIPEADREAENQHHAQGT